MDMEYRVIQKPVAVFPGCEAAGTGVLYQGPSVGKALEALDAANVRDIWISVHTDKIAFGSPHGNSWLEEIAVLQERSPGESWREGSVLHVRS